MQEPAELNDRATTDNGKFDKTPKTSLRVILITALVGFLARMSTNRATDFLKRADACYDALSQYAVSVGSNFAHLSDDMHRPGGLSSSEKDALAIKFNQVVNVPRLKVLGYCPQEYPVRYIDLGYFEKRDIHAWNDRYSAMTNCINATQCSPKNAYSLAQEAAELSVTLTKQATTAMQWGVVRQTLYILLHLF